MPKENSSQPIESKLLFDIAISICQFVNRQILTIDWGGTGG